MNPADNRRPSPKVLPAHLDKRAVVYDRPSSPHQVAEHRESADLQYQLVRRAVELGGPEPRVAVIDEDQGSRPTTGPASSGCWPRSPSAPSASGSAAR